MNDRLNTSLQENIITVLAYDNDSGKTIARMIDANLFEGDYRIIAERCIDYWNRHGEAPNLHTPDLMSDIIEDKQNKRSPGVRRTLLAMDQLKDGMNTKYITKQLTDFSRVQRMKDGILKAAERLNQSQQLAIGEVEEILNGLLRSREIDFDPGSRLHDVDKFLAFMQNLQSEFKTGIEILDKRKIVPYRNGVMLFIAPTGFGKSWFLVHLGKHNLAMRKKVLHISLEMGEEEVQQRYYQAIFAVPKRHMKVRVPEIELDEHKEFKAAKLKTVFPDFAFDSDEISLELTTHMQRWGSRLAGLIIKRFPPRALTPEGLRGYLDNLAATENFIPDLILLDYIGIMNTDAKNHRISLGRVFEEFRAICVERNIAGATAHQASKIGSTTFAVKSQHGAEDWSMIGTADQVLTFSRSEGEKKIGTARLHVDKARSEEDKFTVSITQNYAIGQFALDGVMMNDKYLDMVTKLNEPEDEEEEEEAEDV